MKLYTVRITPWNLRVHSKVAQTVYRKFYIPNSLRGNIDFNRHVFVKFSNVEENQYCLDKIDPLAPHAQIGGIFSHKKKTQLVNSWAVFCTFVADTKMFAPHPLLASLQMALVKAASGQFLNCLLQNVCRNFVLVVECDRFHKVKFCK
jgi:hypothetical protein